MLHKFIDPCMYRSKKTVSKVKQDDHKSLSNPTKTSSKAPGGASGASEPIGSHQKAGSGLSAFKVCLSLILNMHIQSVAELMSRGSMEKLATK